MNQTADKKAVFERLAFFCFGFLKIMLASMISRLDNTNADGYCMTLGSTVEYFGRFLGVFPNSNNKRPLLLMIVLSSQF